MQISSSLQKEEIKDLQQQFYEYFKDGYEFEEFLKEYLIKMGLDEVEVTQRSRDGGIDLKAIRKGVGDFSEVDITHYYIQAKRYALDNKIGVSPIRQLKGTIPFGYKGMLITTSDFVSGAEKVAIDDPSKPVVLINGNSLVTSCIDNEIGFVYKPIFSKNQMDKFMKKKGVILSKKNDTPIINKNKLNVAYIEKLITANDVRARIISIPSSIIEKFTDDMKNVDILVNNKSEHNFNIIRGRNYFGGVTSMLREFNFISDDGTNIAKHSKWFYDSENKIVYINIEEDND